MGCKLVLFTNRSRIPTFDLYQNQWRWMTLNGVMTADPRYLCGSWASCSICRPQQFWKDNSLFLPKLFPVTNRVVCIAATSPRAKWAHFQQSRSDTGETAIRLSSATVNGLLFWDTISGTGSAVAGNGHDHRGSTGRRWPSITLPSNN